jgi:glycosyltransferase involved in cell wall biosynthesis
MNVLQINTRDGAGGAASVAYCIKSALERASHCTSLWVRSKQSRDENVHCINSDNELGRSIDALSGSICGKAIYAAGKSLLPKWVANDIQFHPMRNIEETEEFRDADIIHCHNLHGGFFNLHKLIDYSRAKPVLWTLHDMWALTGHCAHAFECEKWMTGCRDCPRLSIYPEIGWDNTGYLWNRKKKIYAQCDLTIVVPSLWLQRRVAASILGHLPCALVYNGVDTRVFHATDRAAARRRLNLPADKKLLLFVAPGGRKNPWKGFEYVEAAFDRFRARDDVHFVCVGGDDGAARHGSNATSAGYVDDARTLALYYSASDATLFPSLAENFPLVVVESLACGTPVVGFDVGGVKEAIQHAKSGYVARYGDLEDFVGGIERILGLSDLERLTVSEHCTRSVEDAFTAELMVDSYMKLYLSAREN